MNRTDISTPPLTGEGREPREPMTGPHLASLIDKLEQRGVNVWLDGGWGVDALLGEQMREHDDVDFVAVVADAQMVIDVLATDGYRLVQGEVSAQFVLLDDAGRQVDMHMVEFTPQGDGLYRMETGDIWPYPAHGFAGRGQIIGREVRCLTPDVQILCHSGYELDAVDLQDIRTLRNRFGLPEPAPDETAGA